MRVKLKELGTIITGNTPSKKNTEYWDSDDICFVKPDIINENGICFIADSVEYVSYAAKSKARIVGENALFVTCIGSIGKIGIAGKGEYAFNQQINAIVPNETVNAKYLAYAILHNRPQLTAIANAPVVPIINKSQFSEFEINIENDLSKQVEIVTVLDRVMSLINSRQEELVALDELIKARFVEMFGDPSKNPKGYPVEKLSQVGELNRGVSKARPRNKPELLGGPYPLIQTGEISTAELFIDHYTNTYSEAGLAQSKMWPKGTLCITIAANIAQTAILGFDACFPDSVVGFIPHKKVTQIYIHYWFSFFQKILDEQAPQVAQKNINLKILSDLDVMVPPLELQEQFIDIVEQTDKSKVAIQKSLDETQLLFDSLMQEYFG